MNAPALMREKGGKLALVFARSGAGHGTYLSLRKAGGKWTAPRRISSGSDTLPQVASSGKLVLVSFMRTRGARGIYYLVQRAGHWSRAARLRGTRSADAVPALGRPALYGSSRSLELVFARTGRGIYLVRRSGSKWSAPKRISSLRGVSRPSLMLNGGKPYVVFRHSGHGAGLYELAGNKRWSLRKISGTTPTDREPLLSLNGSTLVLAFARPSGKTAGIYVDQLARGRWLAKPRRWTRGKAVGELSRAAAGGSVTVVFARG